MARVDFTRQPTNQPTNQPSQPSLFCARASGARLGDRIQQIHCSPLDWACFPAPGIPLLPPEAFRGV